jgi:hypothetical protein
MLTYLMARVQFLTALTGKLATSRYVAFTSAAVADVADVLLVKAAAIQELCEKLARRQINAREMDRAVSSFAAEFTPVALEAAGAAPDAIHGVRALVRQTTYSWPPNWSPTYYGGVPSGPLGDARALPYANEISLGANPGLGSLISGGQRGRAKRFKKKAAKFAVPDAMPVTEPPKKAKKKAKKKAAKAALPEAIPVAKPAKKKTARKSIGELKGRHHPARRPALKGAKKGSRVLPKRPAKAKAPPGERASASEWQPVFLGVAAPRTARRGEPFTARFAAYVKGLEEQVTTQLKAMADVDAAVGFTPQERASWKKGTRVTVRLSGEHLVAEPAEATFKWNGNQNLLHFSVTPVGKAPSGKTQLRYEAFIANFRVALISVDVSLGTKRSAALRSAKTTPFLKAFASYARADVGRVSDHLSGFSASVRGTKIFMDCLDLVRGEQWKARLRKEITEADTFLLFWSKAAARSTWVEWEWRTARREKREIQPFRLDQPKPLLPKPLAALQADDRYQLARRAYQAKGRGRG